MKKHKHKYTSNTFKCICKISNKRVSNTNKIMKCDSVINTNCACFTKTLRTKQTLVYLFFTLWFFTMGCAEGMSLKVQNVGGHSDGDPAPGRSPGPPPVSRANEIINFKNESINISENKTNNNSEYTAEVSNVFVQIYKRETLNEPTWPNVDTDMKSRVTHTDEEEKGGDLDESMLIITAVDSYENEEDDNGSGFDAPWCDDYSGFHHFSPGSPTDLSLNLTHHLYTTEDGIYPGITYQGKKLYYFYFTYI